MREKPLSYLAWGLPELDQRRGVKAGEANRVREAEESLHGGDISIERGGAACSAVRLSAHGLERALHVINSRPPQIGSRRGEALEKAAADTFVGTQSVARAVGM